MTDKKANLTKFNSGFYFDREGVVYFDIAEFMAEHNLPDLPEVREVLMEELQREFGDTTVTLLAD